MPRYIWNGEFAFALQGKSKNSPRELVQFLEHTNQYFKDFPVACAIRNDKNIWVRYTLSIIEKNVSDNVNLKNKWDELVQEFLGKDLLNQPSKKRRVTSPDQDEVASGNKTDTSLSDDEKEIALDDKAAIDEELNRIEQKISLAALKGENTQELAARYDGLCEHLQKLEEDASANSPQAKHSSPAPEKKSQPQVPAVQPQTSPQPNQGFAALSMFLKNDREKNDARKQAAAVTSSTAAAPLPTPQPIPAANSSFSNWTTTRRVLS